MPIQEIKINPFKTLRENAATVSADEISTEGFQQLCTDLMETLESQFPLGAGLAANQIGALKRVFAVNLELDHGAFLKQIFINPTIVDHSTESEIDWEGCLSIPEQWAKVSRYRSVTIHSFDQDGKKVETKASNFYARLLQHEIDHLDGVLFIDKLETPLVDTPEFERQLNQEKKLAG